MSQAHTREAKELVKQKENETTWVLVHNLFERMLREFCTQDMASPDFQYVHDLLLRSIQSDRSKLNGMSLELLKKLAEACRSAQCLSIYMPVLFKLTGRASKIFISRALEAILVVGKYVDKKSLVKGINDNIGSANKNVRYAVYKLAELRADTLGPLFESYAEKGSKDPAAEVRAICKGMARQPAAEAPRELCKVPIRVLTPRKSIRVEDKQEERIKSLERNIFKITKATHDKNENAAFYEKLNLLKRERVARVEDKGDEMTPKRLDRYLDRYRAIRASEAERNAKRTGHAAEAVRLTPGVAGGQAPGNREILEKIRSIGNELKRGLALQMSAIEKESGEDAQSANNAADSTEKEERAGPENINKTKVDEKMACVDFYKSSQCITPANEMHCQAKTEGRDTENMNSVVEFVDDYANVSKSGISHQSFVRETCSYRNEINSSHSRDASVVHELLDDGACMEIGSDTQRNAAFGESEAAGEYSLVLEESGHAEMDVGMQRSVAYEGSEVLEECSLILEDGECLAEVENLSRSIANFSIEPSKAEDVTENVMIDQAGSAVTENTKEYASALDFVDDNVCAMGAIDEHGTEMASECKKNAIPENSAVFVAVHEGPAKDEGPLLQADTVVIDCTVCGEYPTEQEGKMHDKVDASLCLEKDALEPESQQLFTFEDIEKIMAGDRMKDDNGDGFLENTVILGSVYAEEILDAFASGNGDVPGSAENKIQEASSADASADAPAMCGGGCASPPSPAIESTVVVSGSPESTAACWPRGGAEDANGVLESKYSVKKKRKSHILFNEALFTSDDAGSECSNRMEKPIFEIADEIAEGEKLEGDAGPSPILDDTFISFNDAS